MVQRLLYSSDHRWPNLAPLPLDPLLYFMFCYVFVQVPLDGGVLTYWSAYILGVSLVMRQKCGHMEHDLSVLELSVD